MAAADATKAGAPDSNFFSCFHHPVVLSIDCCRRPPLPEARSWPATRKGRDGVRCVVVVLLGSYGRTFLPTVSVTAYRASNLPVERRAISRSCSARGLGCSVNHRFHLVCSHHACIQHHPPAQQGCWLVVFQASAAPRLSWTTLSDYHHCQGGTAPPHPRAGPVQRAWSNHSRRCVLKCLASSGTSWGPLLCFPGIRFLRCLRPKPALPLARQCSLTIAVRSL